MYLVSTAACFKAIADAYLGTEPGAKRSLAFGLRRVPRLLALYVVTALAFAAASARSPPSPRWSPPRCSRCCW